MLGGLGGPSYTDQPKWNLKALNYTTEIPIVTLDKKEQNPLIVVPQIIGRQIFTTLSARGMHKKKSGVPNTPSLSEPNQKCRGRK